MNCIIVDDDLFSTRIIADFIRRTPELELTATFNNAIDSVEYIRTAQENIGIIFLDIEMPQMSGMDLIKTINIKDAQVVIYSSQEKYALESYEYNVCDYLLKPVTYARFLKAVNKARTEYDKQHAQPTTAAEDDSEIIIKEPSREQFKIRTGDIVMIEACENYITVTTTEKSYTLHTTMKHFMDSIDNTMILRVHRSYAVGIKFIKRIMNNNITLEYSTTNTKTVSIGKSYREMLKTTLKPYCIN